MQTHKTPKGQLFTLIGEVPYTRKDGTSTTLLEWRAHCRREDCGAPFTITTISKHYESSKGFGLVHCKEHRLSRAEVTKIFKAAARAARLKNFEKGRLSRRKVTDADVADIRAQAAAGVKATALALVYPITVNAIRQIIAGHRRK